MITVYYEEYANDFLRKNKEKSFNTLSEFVEWFFGLCEGKWSDKISIPEPDHQVYKDGPGRMEVNCIVTKGICYWIHMIKNSQGIIFSDGKHTNCEKYWNDEVKNLCREMNKRKEKPKFNFV